MWKFLENAKGRPRIENLLRAKELLLELPSLISSIKTFEVGENLNPGTDSFDLVLNSTFASPEALQAYRDHPEHQRVVGFLRAVRSAHAVVDYEC